MATTDYTNLQKEASITVLRRNGDRISIHDALSDKGLDIGQFCGILTHLAKNGGVAILLNRLPDRVHPYKKNKEYIYTQFFDLLATHIYNEHSVAFYASKLCLTPKYLATVIKDVCGKTPSILIKERIVDEIEYMLLYTQDSIKQITDRLKFPSASALGKLFKAHKGISPTNYRKRYAGFKLSALQ